MSATPVVTPPSESAPPVTGLALRLARVVAHVTQTAVAAELGVPRPQVATWEGQLYPTSSAIARYRAALEAIVRRRAEEQA